MNTPIPIETAEPRQADYNRLIALLHAFSEASNQLETLQATINDRQLGIVTENLQEYARLQNILSSAGEELEHLVLSHPEWLGTKRSVKTPFGALKFNSSTRLEIPNEEATLLLLEREAQRDPEFKLAHYVRERVELNREALEGMDDARLKKFRIARVAKDNFTVVPARVDMGKAVKEALAA